jgi:glycosyltransferase involved in cell wall biosynthesis
MRVRRDEWPPVTIVVAALNEAALMSGKLRELAALAYPGPAPRIVVVDGGSSDGTPAIVAAHAARDPRIALVETTLANKIAQLNTALARARTPWMLVTDVDARLPGDALERLMRAVRADDRVAVVGTTAMPRRPYPLDAWHWRLSNALRRLEQRAGRTTGLVVAPCYLFRRSLVDRWPDDAVADDVYVACRAAETGQRAALLDADVEELRSAATLGGWLRHKVRRTLGYQREVLRFLPAAARMTWPMRLVFLWRAVALTAGPPLACAALLAIALALPPLVVAAAALVAIAAGAIPRVPSRGRTIVDALIAMSLPCWLVVVTTAALVMYPFVRQHASYPRAALRIHETEVWP